MFEKKIRDYVNNFQLYDEYFKDLNDGGDEWIAVCSAMDILGDTCEALRHYEIAGIGKDYPEKYLKLYGLLQAIFLQQDSIIQLYKTFKGKALKPLPSSAWMGIRDLRNLTVGHPIASNENKNIRRCFISRVTMNDNAFQLRVYSKDEAQSDFLDIDLKAFYDSYKTEAIIYLEEIHQAQINRWGAINGAFSAT